MSVLSWSCAWWCRRARAVVVVVGVSCIGSISSWREVASPCLRCGGARWWSVLRVIPVPAPGKPLPGKPLGYPKVTTLVHFVLVLGSISASKARKKTPRQWRKEKCTTQLALRNRVCRSGLIHDIPHQVPILVGTASLAMTIPIAKVTHSDTWTHHNWSIIRFIHQATVSPIARQILNKQADTLSLPGPSIYILPKDDQISYFDHQASKDLSPHPVTTSPPP